MRRDGRFDVGIDEENGKLIFNNKITGNVMGEVWLNDREPEIDVYVARFKPNIEAAIESLKKRAIDKDLIMKLNNAKQYPLKNKKEIEALEKELGIEKEKPLTPAEDYKANGVRAASFKKWFGDWEDDPDNASKVVNKDGEPQETYHLSKVRDATGKPVTVYHGTSKGGFESFDKNKIAKGSLYGPGFYFTEDSVIAQQYQKKSDPSKSEVKMFDTQTEYDDWIKTLSDNQRESVIPVFPKNNKEKIEVHFDNPETKSVYLNIRNPFIVEDKITPEIADRLARAIENHPQWKTQNYQNGLSPTDYLRMKGKEGRYTNADAISNISSQIHIKEIKHLVQGKETIGHSVLSKDEWQDLLTRAGFDGITHIGGGIVGDKEHRVWIAFEPNQIKAVSNEGTFSTETANIYKSIEAICGKIISDGDRG